VTAAAFARRTPSRFRDAHSRGRRNYRMAGFQGSDDNEDANGDGGKDSSSADEHSAEVKPKRCKKWAGARSAAVNADGGGDENDSEVNKESVGGSSGLVGSSERLAWGKNGMRSHTRYGSANGSNVKNARSSRISKLADYLRNLEGNDNEVKLIHGWSCCELHTMRNYGTLIAALNQIKRFCILSHRLCI